MDGLSAAASVIAVIQITASLASILRDYYTGVRDAKADIQRLYYSMNSLRTVVAAVKQLNDRFEKSLTLSALLTDQNGPLQSVLLELKRIETKIGGVPKDRSARVLKSLKWPFQKAEVEKMVLAIDSNKSTLALQFTVENL
jgi:predicted oxidoreductase